VGYNFIAENMGRSSFF